MLETKGKTAIAVNESCEFVRVRNKSYHPGQRIVILELHTARIRFAVIAAMVTMLLLFSAIACAYWIPYSTLTVEYGPAVSLKINYLNQVIDAHDSSGEGILTDADLLFKDTASAVDVLSDLLFEQGVFSGRGKVKLIAKCADSARAQEVLDTVKQSLQSKVNLGTLSVSEQILN